MSVDSGVNWLGAMQANQNNANRLGDIHKYIADLKAKNIDNKISEYAAVEAKNKLDAYNRIREGTSTILSDLDKMTPSEREQSTPESRYANTMDKLNKVMLANPVYGGEVVKPIAEALSKVKEADQEAVMKQMKDRFTAEIKGRIDRGEKLTADMLQQVGVLNQIFESNELAQISVAMGQGERGTVDIMRTLGFTEDQQQRIMALRLLNKGSAKSKTSGGSAAKIFSAATEISQSKEMLAAHMGDDYEFGDETQLASAAQAFHDKVMELSQLTDKDGNPVYTRPGDMMYDAWIYMTQVSGEIYPEALGPGPATREQWDDLSNLFGTVRKNLVFDPEKARAARKEKMKKGEVSQTQPTPGGVQRGMAEEQQAQAQEKTQRPPLNMDQIDRNLAGSVPNIPTGPGHSRMDQIDRNLAGSVPNIPTGPGHFPMDQIDRNLAGSVPNIPMGPGYSPMDQIDRNLAGSVPNIPMGPVAQPNVPRGPAPSPMAQIDRNLAGSVPNIPMRPTPYGSGAPQAQNNVSAQMNQWRGEPGTAQIRAATPPAPPTRMRPLSMYEEGQDQLMDTIKKIGSGAPTVDTNSQWAREKIARIDPLRPQTTPQMLFPPEQMDEQSLVLNLIKEHEGFRSKAYKDSTGKWTIGYGTTKGVKPGDRISPYEALQRAKQELQGIEKKIDRTFPGLTVNQKTAVASLVYNVGWERFRISKAFRNLKDKNVQRFLVEAFDRDQGFTKARNERTGKLETLEGLVKRRANEMRIFLS